MLKLKFYFIYIIDFIIILLYIIIYLYYFIIISALKKYIYHKTACTSLPEDEHLDVRNVLKTL